MADECKNHDCPKCGDRMTNRVCLRCKDDKGNHITMRYCVFCDNIAPIHYQNIDGSPNLESFSDAVREFLRDNSKRN